MAQNSAQVSGLKKPFCYEFVDEGRSCKFQANVNIPGDISKVDEFGKRIVNYHGLPVYLEEGNFLNERGQSGCEHSLLGAVLYTTVKYARHSTRHSTRDSTRH